MPVCREFARADLLEGDEKDLNEVIASLGSLPLANRKLAFEPRRILVPTLLFAVAIAATSFGLVPSSVAFTATVLALVLVNALRPGEVYAAIDWSVIVLLAAMIPFGEALENTGTAQMPSEAPATLGVATGSPDAKMTQDEIAALRAQIERCWVIPTGWTHPREVSVTIRFALTVDGMVRGRPEVVEFPASQYGPVAADNAIRAVQQCGPYKLPAEKYDQWSVVQLRFTPPG